MKIKACCILLLLLLRVGQAQNWALLNGGATDVVHCVFGDTVNNVVYATGFFTSIGGVSANHIAKWDGATWQQVGSGLPNESSSAHAFDIYNGDLILMNCLFSSFHSQVGRWNGSGWDSIGNNFRDGLFGIRVFNNELYAYGEFLAKNSTIYNSLAKWDGTDWGSIGFPYKIGTSPARINCLGMYQNELYAGGLFLDSLGGDAMLAKFNGSYWSIVGGGIHGSFDQVTDMEVYQNELYIAGNFKANDGNISSGILRWDNNSLRDVGGGITTNYIYNQIADLVVMDNKLYAGGHFEEIGGIPANEIASWDGVNWCGFGNTDYSSINCLTAMNHELYLCTGQIWDVDTMNYITKSIGIPISDTCGHISVGINEQNSITENLTVYPNPATNQISVEFTLIDNKHTFIEVKNVLGQTVKKIDGSSISNGVNRTEINVNELPNGLYFIQLKNGDKVSSIKVVKQ
ncbi:MAG: hypothetical protein JWO44_1980 [Bacteroidetes bacterium]|nr:hypothetical protein [Bacteroidota bacterium]